MADNVDAETRSRIMRSITSRDTGPELAVAAMLHGMGADFDAHAEDLPGTPDFALRDEGIALFVHGCFWHRHDCHSGNQVPDTNTDYWVDKFDRNVERDREARLACERQGWEVVVVWECELDDDPAGVRDRIKERAFGGEAPVESWAESIV